MHWDTATVAAVLAAIAGWFVPRLIARIPEPPEGKPPTEKIAYVDLAAAPGLAWKCALASGLAAGAIGLEIGWVWPLTFLLYLCPISVALAFIDYRVWLLPKRIIVPSYAVVGALIVLCGLVTGDTDALIRAAIGMVAARTIFWLLWFLPHGLNLRGFTLAIVFEVALVVVAGSIRDWTAPLLAVFLAAMLAGFGLMMWCFPKGGMGFGDVRLSALLGMVLGYLGWDELVYGMFLAFILGSVGWIPLRLLRITKSRKFPFGPFMLVGALIGVLWGSEIADWFAALRV